MAERTVVVVGGGITGLTAARSLLSDAPEGTHVLLLEASERLGGKLRTENLDGIQIEAGADSFLAREPDALALCGELGLRDELVAPAVFGGLVWNGTRALPLPSGTVMGIPTSTASVLGARTLSPWGKARALGDLVIPGRLHGNDVSVAALVRRRFGSEVLEGMVDPILAGTRAGVPDEMSLRSSLPQIDKAARSHRSLMLGLRKLRRADDPGHPLFYAPGKGMSRLVDALHADLTDAEIHTERPAVKVTARRRGNYLVDTEDGDRIEAAGVVIALPATAAAKLLADLSDGAAGGLARIRHASVAVMMLVFEAGALRIPPGSSGVLVPSAASGVLSAATWWSAKWPHTVPDDRVVVRAFVGRSGRHEALDRPDEDLVAAAVTELNQILRSAAHPAAWRVVRWEDALAQYDVGHGGRVSRIEGALEPHSGIVLAGADYRGSGIPDCIGQGITAARRVAASL